MTVSVRRESGIEDVRRLFSCSDEGKDSTENAITSHQLPRVRDWSNLSRDLCNFIAEKITFHPHLWKFAMTCKEWCNAAKALNDRPSILLMLPYNKDTSTCRFITLEENPKNYHLKLPELRDHWICGSAKGWLAMTDHNFNFLLFNPLTRHQISLPKPSDLDPSMIPTFYKCVLDPQNILPCERNYYVKKVVMSDTPNLGSSANCLVAIIFSSRFCLAACRLGDASWTIIPPMWKTFIGYDDIIIHEDRIYAAQESGILVADYHGPDNVATRRIEAPFELYNGVVDKVYVAISSGRLLYIERYLVPYPKKKMLWENIKKELTARFKVYMLEESGLFKEISDLGGETLFLGSSCSMSVSAKSRDFAPWCKPNCIYFLADQHCLVTVEKWGYQWDNGIFGMEEDRVVERFDLNHSPFYWPAPAFWITQNM